MIKTDMSKAYDRVQWDFILEVLVKLGFSSKWISLIMQCVTTVSYAVLINGSYTERFVPSCRLRQGDLLSPLSYVLRCCRQ